MTILINTNVSPKVYANANDVPTYHSNQMVYHQSELTDFIHHQQNVNRHVTESLSYMQKEHESLHSVVQRLDRIEERYDLLVQKLESGGLVHQAILDEVTAQHQSTQQLSTKLKSLETSQTDFVRHQQEQKALFDEMSKRLAIQEAFHETVFDVLDKQTAMTERIVSQLNRIKDLISEKVVHFVKKTTKGVRHN